jgi:hypothetical protein
VCQVRGVSVNKDGYFVGRGAWFGKPKRDAPVESHPCVQNAQGWGTRKDSGQECPPYTKLNVPLVQLSLTKFLARHLN